MDNVQDGVPGDSLVLSAIRRLWQDAVGIVGVLVLPLVCGCSPAKNLSPSRLERGYAVILPGIEGTSYLNRNVAKGLIDGGWPGAVEVYDWTAGSVFLFPVNLRALERNKHEAEKVARKIVAYQSKHPGKPVHIIGHSGGGGVAVLALEALPPDRQITSAILLAPAISPDYDLRQALRHTEQGVWNFYSRHDVGFLKAGTMFMGTMDGQHTSAAGAVGFHAPWGLDDAGRRLYATKLRQQPYSRKMADSGHTGSHVGWAEPRFVAEWLCPIMLAQTNDRAVFAADSHESNVSTPEAQRADGVDPQKKR
jgi:pimeloyl-ACP methyl ester carboxylesterase